MRLKIKAESLLVRLIEPRQGRAKIARPFMAGVRMQIKGGSPVGTIESKTCSSFSRPYGT
jgi:hypothetical protein